MGFSGRIGWFFTAFGLQTPHSGPNRPPSESRSDDRGNSCAAAEGEPSPSPLGVQGDSRYRIPEIRYPVPLLRFLAGERDGQVEHRTEGAFYWTVMPANVGFKAGMWYHNIGVSVGYKPVIGKNLGQVPMYNSMQIGISVRY